MINRIRRFHVDKTVFHQHFSLSVLPIGSIIHRYVINRATKSQNFSAFIKVHEMSTSLISRSYHERLKVIRSKKVKIYH